MGGIENMVSRELEQEEFDNIGEFKSSPPHSLINYQKDLGIQMNQEGLSSPRFGKYKRKRGKKSLKELREADGLCREQIKIDDLLHNGKGKFLPKAS